RQHLILLLLWELQVLLAEEAEPRTLRPVLAAGIAAAHVALETARLPGNSVALPEARCGQCRSDMFGEKLGEVVNENIEGMRGAFGHAFHADHCTDLAPNGLIRYRFGTNPGPFGTFMRG